jgi:hypothetical protein
VIEAITAFVKSPWHYMRGEGFATEPKSHPPPLAVCLGTAKSSAKLRHALVQEWADPAGSLTTEAWGPGFSHSA